MLCNSDSITFFIFLKKVVDFSLNIFHLKHEDKAIYCNSREKMYEMAKEINEE
jgi:hypothetical protein